MDDNDAFFTQTIVGAPSTMVLGRRTSLWRPNRHGVEVDLSTGETRLSDLWRDWVVLSHESDTPGVPRRRPKALRRLLERRALLIASIGLLCLAASLALSLSRGAWPWP